MPLVECCGCCKYVLTPYGNSFLLMCVSADTRVSEVKRVACQVMGVPEDAADRMTAVDESNKRGVDDKATLRDAGVNPQDGVLATVWMLCCFSSLSIVSSCECLS